jgi:hypothetical protein
VESNHRAQLRRLPLYPLSYGALEERSAGVVARPGFARSRTQAIAEELRREVIMARAQREPDFSAQSFEGCRSVR